MLISSNAGQLSTDTPPKQITFTSFVGVKLGTALARRRNADKPQRLKHAHRRPIEADPQLPPNARVGRSRSGLWNQRHESMDFVNSSDPVFEARACNLHLLYSVNLQVMSRGNLWRSIDLVEPSLPGPGVVGRRYRIAAVGSRR